MKSFILWVSLLLFGGCAFKQYVLTEPKVIILKTPKIKFADTGYVRSTGDSVEVELFTAGQVVGKIAINHLVCVQDEGCMSKSGFNESYLNEAYPDTILQHILLGKPIFDSENLKKNNAGFEQYIYRNTINIIYKVNEKQIYFKDKQNKILIKIKEIP
ncbi:MAG: hypothetical protein DRG24_06500 [Epsilonproteobacteria bacterium]|nr:MAG: hypothetical protein DRG24_06500 [Campylobacterota bacterium]